MSRVEVGRDCFIGYTSQDSVKLDFDHTTFKRVKGFCEYLLDKQGLGGFMILCSSENNYHAIFDKTVMWGENVTVMGLTGMIFKGDVGLWVLMQCIKGHSTLRISNKFGKGRPRIVWQEGSQDNEIKAFRKYRELFRRFQ